MEKHTNHLITETSPYLLQHAHNPVDWHSWGPEALEKAKHQDKPILLSIGYSACHWCHVMEKESFENEATAYLMNERFINIKVDREERPDLDHIYMEAVQAMSGSGGWPLNVFLTPDCKPFYGGTYFPPVRAFNRASWKEVLLGVSELFSDKRDQVEAQAEALIQHISTTNGISETKLGHLTETENIFSRKDVENMFSNVMKQADKTWGGFGSAPKFPQTFVLNFLLRYSYFMGNTDARAQAFLSLDKMAMGGIYDQVGGGFARYSTDAEWLVPHFEKMLYDNALLLSTMADAYRVNHSDLYEKVIRSTISFLQRELMDVSGTFYSALDADSEGVEGKYYVWSYEEVNELLGDNATLFCNYFDITPGGNWEHSNIPRILVPIEQFAVEKEVDKIDLEKHLQASLLRLFESRNTRCRPGLDDKVILGWNGLLITALCKVSAALKDENFRQLAIQTFSSVWDACIKDGFEFYHTTKNGNAKYPAFLDDYAFLAEACIHLQEITSDQNYLSKARGLCEFVESHFQSDSDYFYYTSIYQKDIVVRKAEIFDSAIPSGNSVMAFNLGYLGMVYNNQEWKNQSVRMITGIKNMIEKYPSSFGNWACLLLDQMFGIEEVVISGKSFQHSRNILLQEYIPNKVLQSLENPSMSDLPLLSGKPYTLQPVLYHCHNYSCELPETDIAGAIKELLIKRNYQVY